jgi:iron complex outermembrane recepter protein
MIKTDRTKDLRLGVRIDGGIRQQGAPKRYCALMLALAGVLALPVVPMSANAQTPAPPAAKADAQLPAVEVVGRRQSGDYLADDAAGTKSELPLRELPQAVRVLSRQTIDDLGAVRLDDTLDYVGGVSRQNHFGGLWDNVAIRGLAGDINNGMALLSNGFSANRGFNAPRDTANIERIEFLKGPVASLYGVTEPGGTINLVSKRPVWQRAVAAEVYAGSFGFRRGTLDVTGPLHETVAGRLNVAVEQRDGFRDFVDTRRSLFAPTLTWQPTASTRIDYIGEYLSHATPLDRGVVAIGTTLGAVPRERFLGEPADGRVTVKNVNHQLIVEQALGTDWRAQFALGYKDGSLNGFSTEAQAALQDERTLRRQRRYRDYHSDDVSLQAEVIGKLVLAGVNHEVRLGVEGYRFAVDQLMLRINPSAGAPYAIDVLTPRYGQTQPTPLPNTQTREEQRATSLYAQDSVTWGAWRVVGGLRVDQYRQSLENQRTGVTTRQSPSEVTPRLGVSYLPNSQWTVFANTGRSFRPNSGTSAAGAAFDPESGIAYEAGVKWESVQRNMGATLAAFDIRKQNVLTSDPLNAGFSIAAGEVRSRGVDADWAGQLTREWRVNASLSYINASIRRDNSLAVGSRLLNVPKFNASVLLVHERSLNNGQRIGLGGGLTHSSTRLGEARTQAQADLGAPSFNLPAYTLGKLVAYWRVSPTLRLSMDIDNVTDKTYYTQSFQRTWVAPGPPRSVTFGLQARF